MNLRKVRLKLVRVFDSYSSLDVPIVREASRCGLALIGGTATQLLARKYHVRERRQRSINDLDFITSGISNKRGIEIFKKALDKWNFSPIKMGDSDFMLNYENKSDGVEVDVLISYETGLMNQFITVNGILVIDPCYAFLTKVQRISSGLSTKNVTDKQDINTLYDVIESMGRIEDLEELLSNSNLDISEEDLNKLLQEDE